VSVSKEYGVTETVVYRQDINGVELFTRSPPVPTMSDWSRRSFLAAGTTAVAALAGCTQAPGIGGDDDSTGSAGSGRELETLDVGGSPGESVPVQPAGNAVLLDFFATWCAPCKAQMPNLRAVRESYPDAHMLSISPERDEAAIRQFWTDHQGTWPVANDPQFETGQEYEVNQSFPTTIVFGPDGEEVWRHTGLASADDMGAQLEAATE
jgi:thiol-disulfide isomerase/thioredoxin